MYFDFEDYRPDIPTLDRSLTQLEIVLLTIVVHLLLVISILAWPHLTFVKAMYAAQEARIEAQREREMDNLRNHAQFVFVAPKVEIRTQVPPKLAELSDRNRRAQTMEKAPDPKNDVAFSRGNAAEKIVSDARRDNPQPSEQPSAAAKANSADNGAAPETDPNALRLPRSVDGTFARNEPSKNPTLGGASGILSDAIKNVQKYSQGESLQNVQGNGDFGPSIQFDTKGVDFGPWLRRFVAQIRRNWFVPYAAMSLRGHVVLSFKVHRDGSITDLQIMQPSSIDAFTKSAFNAIKLTNPTVPLPLEFPDENAPFIVTFYFNETPPGGGS
ncbi:MAG TPA: TonB family protein [Vicinamibacterales bacterium]